MPLHMLSSGIFLNFPESAAGVCNGGARSSGKGTALVPSAIAVANNQNLKLISGMQNLGCKLMVFCTEIRYLVVGGEGMPSPMFKNSYGPAETGCQGRGRWAFKRNRHPRDKQVSLRPFTKLLISRDEMPGKPEAIELQE